MTTTNPFKTLIEFGYTLAELAELADGGRYAHRLIAEHVDSDGYLCDQEIEALEELGLLVEMCRCHCGCDRPAVTTDDGGVPVCEACSSSALIGGEIVCGNTAEIGRVCPKCGAEIEWGSIVTGDPGSGGASRRYGQCACPDHEWIDWERGNWGNYEYIPKVED